MRKINPITIKISSGELHHLEFRLVNLDFTKIASENDLNPFTVLIILDPLKKVRDKVRNGITSLKLDISTAAALYIVLNGEISAPCIRVRLELEKYIINTYSTLEQLLIKVPKI